MLAALAPAFLGAIVTNQECDKTSATPMTIFLKWDMFSSEWGSYTVTGCTGVNPKLNLTAGTTYTFDQSDETNWCDLTNPALLRTPLTH